MEWRRLAVPLLMLIYCPLSVISWINIDAQLTLHRRSMQHNYFYSTGEDEFECEDVNNNQPNKRLLVFGLGNIGTIVTRRASTVLPINGTSAFERVYGTTRSGKEIPNVQSIQFDSYECIRDIIPSCTHILITIPPIDSESANDTTLVGGRHRKWNYFCDAVLNNPSLRLTEIAKPNTWIGFVSSTSVYGNHDGDWVSEESDVKCEPASKYLRAENEWIDAANSYGWRLNVFRCAGLYGDGRSALHTIRKRGIQLENRSSAKKLGNPTSRIHEEDAARAILCAMLLNNEDDGDTCVIYNLADDMPAPRSEVMAFGHELLGASDLLPNQKPQPAGKQPSERDRRRKSDSKRVDNTRMKERLLPEGLMYPTYREGLQAVLDKNRNKWRETEKLSTNL